LPESIRIAIEEQSQTGEARRLARTLASESGLDDVRVEQVAIVVTEVCTNILKHGRNGEILLRNTDGDDLNSTAALEILALDQGPGMSNLDRSLRDGFSTGSSPGQGLGAIVRLSAESDFYTLMDRGTGVLARWLHPPVTPALERIGALRVGAINVCKPGQEVCGDSWGIHQSADESVVLMADGLGHGLEAKMASREAVRTLQANPDLGPGELINRVHQALRSSRGAAVAVAKIDRVRQVITYSGIGNISAQIYSGGKPCQHLVSVNGTAGHQTQRVREFEYAWPEAGMLVLHSDGLATNAGLEAHPGLASHDPTLIAGILYRDFTRRNDDATLVVAKAA
jgi:anti-sigma regulatory factor (Ser/Thr protein kinase)